MSVQVEIRERERKDHICTSLFSVCEVRAELGGGDEGAVKGAASCRSMHSRLSLPLLCLVHVHLAPVYA